MNKKIKKSLVIIFLFVNLFSISAQSPKVDSLFQELKKVSVDDYDTKNKIVNKLSEFVKDKEGILDLLDDIMEIAVSKNDTLLMCESLESAGYDLCNLGVLELGYQKFDKAVQLAQQVGNYKFIAYPLKHKAFFLGANSEPERALFTAKEACKYAKLSRDNNLLSNAYNSLATVYNKLGLDEKELLSLDTAYMYVEKTGNEYMKLVVLSNKANYYKFKDAKIAIQKYKEILNGDLIGNDQELRANTYNAISGCYSLLMQSDSAIFYAHKSLDIAEEYDLKRREMAAHYSLGIVYDNRSNPEKVFYHGNKSKLLAIELNDEGYYATGVGIEFEGLRGQDRLDEGIELLLQSEEFIQEDSYWLAEIYLKLAEAYMIKKDYEKAIAYCLKGERNALNFNGKLFLANFYVMLAQINFEMNEYEKSENYAKKSYEIAKNNGYVVIVKYASEALYKVYRKTNKVKALDYLEEFVAIKDSTFNAETTRKAEELRLTRQFEKEKLELELEQKELESIATRNKSIVFYLSGILNTWWLFSLQIEKEK